MDPVVPGSLAARARARRWAEFHRRFPDVEVMSVLDLGGAPEGWADAGKLPARLVFVNLEPVTVRVATMTAVRGDACDVPASVRGERFDLVFSNSLIEHVGGYANRCRLADTVHTKASRHWVQTPYRYFPIEPHWLFPAFQFLPLPARAAISRRWPVGHIRSSGTPESVRDAAGVELMGLTEMRGLFPDSELWLERFAGLVKSVVAVRGGTADQTRGTTSASESTR